MEGVDTSQDVRINFRNLFNTKIKNGTSFKFEIDSNGNAINFNNETTKFKPIKKGNLYFDSGDYKYLEEGCSEEEHFKKLRKKDEDMSKIKWMIEFLKNTVPQRVILNKKNMMIM